MKYQYMLLDLVAHIYTTYALLIYTSLVLGFVIIVAMQYFPGQPFDYEADLVRLQGQLGSGATRPVDEPQNLQEQKEEIDKVVSQLKIDQLQQALGLEAEKIQAIIAQAKEDALEGKTPDRPVNYVRYFDGLFYFVTLSLLVYVGCRDYDIDLLQLLQNSFPREAETLRQLKSMAESTFEQTSDLSSSKIVF